MNAVTADPTALEREIEEQRRLRRRRAQRLLQVRRQQPGRPHVLGRGAERALEGGELTLPAWPWRLACQEAVRGDERAGEEPDVLGAHVGLEQLHDAGDAELAQWPNAGLLADGPQELIDAGLEADQVGGELEETGGPIAGSPLGAGVLARNEPDLAFAFPQQSFEE